MDTLDGMRTFVAVVREGSFTAAAKKLGMSTALTSKYVGQLETRLGTRLMNRTTRSLNLTEAGAAYVERAQRILDDVAVLEGSLGDAAAGPNGTLVVSAPVSFGETVLASIVAAFLDHDQTVDIDLRLTDSCVSPTDEGVDVALRIGAPSDAGDAGEGVRQLAPVHVLACAAPDYLARHGVPSRPGDLENHQCLIDRSLQDGATWSFGNGLDAQEIRVKGRLITKGAAVIRVLLLAGHGIARIPGYAVSEDIRHGRLQTVLAGWEVKPVGLHAVFAQENFQTARARAFVDFVASRYRVQGWNGESD